MKTPPPPPPDRVLIDGKQPLPVDYHVFDKAANEWVVNKKYTK